MEANPIFSNFLTAARQYVLNPIELNLLNMQRQLDMISALMLSSCPDEIFDPSQLVIVECFSSFVYAVLNYADKPSLLQRVFGILQVMGGNKLAFDVLQSKFHLHSVISTFLQQYGFNVGDSMVTQCLLLLEMYTANVSVPFIESHMGDLIHALIKEINNKSPEISNRVLLILSNLCRSNPAVQAHIRNVEKLRELYKSLLSKLRSSVYTDIMYSLSIMANINCNDKDEKLFTESHLNQGFELIVLLLRSKDESSSLAALNLFHDLTDLLHSQQFYSKYTKLGKCLAVVADTYCEATPDQQSTRLLSFFNTIAKTESNRRKVYACLVRTDGENTASLHPLLWNFCTKLAKSTSEAPLYALKLVKVLTENCDDKQFQSLETCLVEMASKLLESTLEIEDFSSCFVKQKLDLQVASFEFFRSMCRRPILRTFISNNVNLKRCRDMIFSQMDNNALYLEESRWSDSGVNLLMTILCLLIDIQELPAAQQCLSELLGEPRLMPFIAHGLSMTSSDQIHKSLLIISQKINDSELPMLVESIVTINHKHPTKSQRYGTKGRYFESSDFVESSVTNHTHETNDSFNVRVQSVIEKIEKGLDLRSLKISEILKIYEYQMASLNLRERNLQSLLCAKTTALQKADCMLSTYKCCQAQKETEVLKLRRLLIEAEIHSEDAKEQSSQVVRRNLDLQEELQSSRQDATSAKQEIVELKKFITELNEMIEEMKEEQEREKKLFSKQLKEKNIDIEELRVSVEKKEGELKKKCEDYLSLEASGRELANSLEQQEKQTLKVKQELELLERVCQQHETKIQERDAHIKTLTEDLEQHMHITNMIHKMSSKVNISTK